MTHQLYRYLIRVINTFSIRPVSCIIKLIPKLTPTSHRCRFSCVNHPINPLRFHPKMLNYKVFKKTTLTSKPVQ